MIRSIGTAFTGKTATVVLLMSPPPPDCPMRATGTTAWEWLWAIMTMTDTPTFMSPATERMFSTTTTVMERSRMGRQKQGSLAAGGRFRQGSSTMIMTENWIYLSPATWSGTPST